MEEIKVTTKSLEETQKVAFNLAKNIKNGSIICLYGDLGNGKTTFVQGLAKGLGITKRIISPTFVIIRSYFFPNNKIFYHVDLYRLRGEEDLESIGLLEIFEDKNAIIAIEWPEKMGSLLPKKRLDVKLKYIDENNREITLINL